MNRRLMPLMMFAAIALAPIAAKAGDAPPAAERQETGDHGLARRIESLEQEVRELREIVAPIQRRQAAARRQQDLQRLAKERREAEKAALTEQEIAEIDALFKAATQPPSKPAGEAALATLAEKYPDADRTGAAFLQAGQARRDAEGERLLRLAAERYGAAVNAAGVQVGPFARFALGMRLWNDGRKDEARPLFATMLADAPQAVGPRGNLLAEMLPAGWDQAAPAAAPPAPEAQ